MTALLRVGDDMRALAIQAWVSGGKRMTQRQTEACRTLGIRPDQGELVLSMYSTGRHPQHAAYHPQQPSLGCTRVTHQLQGDVEQRAGFVGRLFDPAGVDDTRAGAQHALVRRHAPGRGPDSHDHRRTASWPTADDTGNKAVLLGQNTSIGSSVDPNFTKVYWDAYKFSSQPILVPYELLQDKKAIDLVARLGQMLGERLGRGTNTYYTTGTGRRSAQGHRHGVHRGSGPPRRTMPSPPTMSSTCTTRSIRRTATTSAT